MSDEHIDATWKEHPEHIRKYYDLLPMHERLCVEVEYILKTEIESSKIEYAHITHRAKSLPSFCEKVHRKSCKDPFVEITDYSGVRLVYLYISEIDRIKNIIEKEFEIIEKTNKVSDQDVDRFGYGALHYLIKIKKGHSGARYDDLKDLICEIQVKTILQDAWAIVAHHLSYKHELDIPKELRRKLNALSGLFETADDQFESLRLARNQYQERIKKEISKNAGMTLEQDINLDNLVAYIKWKYPDRKSSSIDSIAELLSELQEYGYTRLVDIDEIVNTTAKAVLAYENENPPVGKSKQKRKYAGIGIIRFSLSFVNNDYCSDKYSDTMMDDLAKFRHLIK